MILDIILIAIFICIILYGYKKGAVGIIAKLITVILSFVLAYLFAGTIGEYISKTDFGINLQTSITNTITNKFNSPSDSEVILKIQETIGNSTENEITLKIVRYIFTSIGFAAVFVISRIVLWIAQKVLESIFELPVLKTFNKLVGIIAAILLFVIELSIILAIIRAISAFTFMNTAVKVIDSSVITKAVYDHNIITNLILTKLINRG